MGRHDRLFELILRGGADANVAFDELRGLLRHLGFEERVRGSHHIFRRAGVSELINLQRDGNKAKVYQVRQVRAIFTKYALGGETGTTAEEG
jgi:hypothetical protein